MKALTLTQPWATEVALGHKRVETRSWYTAHRGPLAIHAAKGFPAAAKEFAMYERAVGRLPERVPRSAIVAIVDLRHCVRTEDYRIESSALERSLGDFSTGRWAWLFERGHIWVPPEPIPARGALGLWEWEPTLELPEWAMAKPWQERGRR